MSSFRPIISLCLPTSGVVEWVFPVLDSIYAQKIDEASYEVIVTDNGGNEEFGRMMEEYAKEHKNLIYQKNDSYMFYNQIEALKLAQGEYLKFVNHRSPFVAGAIQELIRIIQENENKKPTLYFSNGELKEGIITCNSFDSFVTNLGIYASWTTGVGIWREEFNQVKDSIQIDKISPHSCFLFSRRHDDEYRIYNFEFCKEIKTDHSKKGKYNLFKAFGVEELAITQNLYIDGDITANTFKKVKKDYQRFLSDLYWQFCVRKTPCSYDLSGFDDAMGIYFSKASVISGAYLQGIMSLVKKIIGREHWK